MRNLRLHAVAAAVLLAPFFACAAGSESPAVDPGAIAPQSANNDAGGEGSDAGTPVTNNPTPTEDAGSPAASEDAGAVATPSDDASTTPVSEDAGTAPPVQDSAATPPVQDAGAPASSCPGYAPPDTASTCNACAGESDCTANGCYNGYYCKLSTSKCVAPPSGC